MLYNDKIIQSKGGLGRCIHTTKKIYRNGLPPKISTPLQLHPSWFWLRVVRWDSKFSCALHAPSKYTRCMQLDKTINIFFGANDYKKSNHKIYFLLNIVRVYFFVIPKYNNAIYLLKRVFLLTFKYVILQISIYFWLKTFIFLSFCQ